MAQQVRNPPADVGNTGRSPPDSARVPCLHRPFCFVSLPLQGLFAGWGGGFAMLDDDSRASTSSSSSSSSNQQTEKEANTPKKKESKVSMSKNSKLLSTSAKRYRTPPRPQSWLPIARTASGCTGSASSEGSLHAPQSLCVLKKGKKDLESPNYFSLLLLLFFLLILVYMQLLWLASPVSCCSL